jgi:hypothetical protein
MALTTLLAAPTTFLKTTTLLGVGKVQGAGAGWTVGKVRTPECRGPALSAMERPPR